MCKPSSVTTFTADTDTDNTHSNLHKADRVLKSKKKSICGWYPAPEPFLKTYLCDFETKLIEMFLFFFFFLCNPHRALPHPHRRLDRFKQTRFSSTTSSPSACRRKTTATTPPSTSWPHLRRYVSDCERPTATAAVTFIRINDCSVSTRRRWWWWWLRFFFLPSGILRKSSKSFNT